MEDIKVHQAHTKAGGFRPFKARTSFKHMETMPEQTSQIGTT